MLLRLRCLLFLSVLLHISLANIPSYIKVCKRNDPKIDECIINSIYSLKPKLIQGIPELDVPALDPLHFDEFVVSRGGAFKAIGTNVIAKGAANFKITNLKSDVKKLTFEFGLTFPYMNIEADYDVNMKLLAINLQGKGPLKSNNSDVTVAAVLQGYKDKNNHVLFNSLDMNIKWKNYNIRLENLFGGDKTLGDAVNIAINENKKEMINLIRPTVEKMIAEKLLSIANKVTQHFTYDELFPAK